MKKNWQCLHQLEANGGQIQGLGNVVDIDNGIHLE